MAGLRERNGNLRSNMQIEALERADCGNKRHRIRVGKNGFRGAPLQTGALADSSSGWREPGGWTWRVYRAAGRVRIGQVNAAEPDCRAGPAGFRRDCGGRL